MVKRNVLEKMSNKELLKHLKPDSKFVAQVIDVAFDILKKRNHKFMVIEEERIRRLVETKRNIEDEQYRKSSWNVGEDSEKGIVSFYS